MFGNKLINNFWLIDRLSNVNYQFWIIKLKNEVYGHLKIEV